MNEKTITSLINSPDLSIRKFENTRHEIMFSVMYPHLKRQVTFGTGKGGLEKWTSKKFTVDFLDTENSIAYEIDGKSHDSEIARITDKIKEYFLETKGIKTVRFSNDEVEEAYTKWSKVMEVAFNEFIRSY